VDSVSFKAVEVPISAVLPVLWRCWFGSRKCIPPVKKLRGGMLTWLCVWVKVQIRIWLSWCHCHSLSCSSKSRLVLPFWCRLTQAVPDRIQEGYKMVVCVCVSVCYRQHMRGTITLLGAAPLEKTTSCSAHRIDCLSWQTICVGSRVCNTGPVFSFSGNGNGQTSFPGFPGTREWCTVRRHRHWFRQSSQAVVPTAVRAVEIVKM